MVPPFYFLSNEKFLFILLSLLPLLSIAQYYNPYGLYQQQQQANQNAYNMGAGWGMYMNGISALCNGDYSEAFNQFYRGIDYNTMNYEGLGICYELGFGVAVNHGKALNAYTIGANDGNFGCKQALKRIRESGYYKEANKQVFLQNLKAMYNANYGTTPNIGSGGSFGGYSNGYGSSSGSSSYTCPTCHGTGRCTVCAGRGYRISNNRHIECTMCNGGGACYGCHGRGTIR